MLGTSAVVGTTIPVAVGFALAFKRTRSDSVAVAFFGDGATEEGVFTESLNFASLHKLPVLFVCENNYYAIHTPVTRRWATQRLCERVATYGIPAHQIDDGDVLKLRAVDRQFARRDAPRRRPCVHRMPHLPLARARRPERGLLARLSRALGSRAVDRGRPGGQPRRAARRPTAAHRSTRRSNTRSPTPMAFAETSPFPDLKALYTNVFA